MEKKQKKKRKKEREGRLIYLLLQQSVYGDVGT
jgi:hypothetical protein